MMTIKELEEAVGMTRANIRFYEQEGLLSPARSANGYRDYSPEDAAALEKTKLLRRLHLDLNTLRRLQAGELTLAEALKNSSASWGGTSRPWTGPGWSAPSFGQPERNISSWTPTPGWRNWPGPRPRSGSLPPPMNFPPRRGIPGGGILPACWI